MKRNKLLSLLHAYQPSFDELSTKQRMVEFIEHYEQCFERSLAIGHITASAWLLNKAGTHALLMHHTKLNMWVQPGGHCDGHPDPLYVALKEAQEESGIQHIEPVSEQIFDIDIHRIPARKHEPEHDHYDVRFLLQVVSDEPVVQNSESQELRWMSKEHNELPTREPSVVRMFSKWIEINT